MHRAESSSRRRELSSSGHPRPDASGGIHLTKRELDALRAEIERIDYELVQLIAQRREVSKEIGLVKRKESLPIKNKPREAEVLRRLEKQASALGVDKRLVSKICRELIEDSAKIQESLPEGHLRGEKALVVGGAGRMGEWMCRFLSDRGADVVVLDRRGKLGGYKNLKSLANDATNSDIVVVASPLGVSQSDLEAVLKASPRGLVFDLCSVKSHISHTLTSAAKNGTRITSVHPMFGPTVASPMGRNVLVCRCGCREADEEASDLFESSGANVSTVSLEKHDELMAYVLGLSHMCALLFGSTLQRSGKPSNYYSQAQGPTFKKLVTMAKELSHESRRIYHDIQALNPNTRHVIASMEDVLREIKKAALETDHARFSALMESNREYLEVK